MNIQSIIQLFFQAFVRFPLNPLFWLVLLLVGTQYRRITQNEMKLLGRFRHALWKQILSSLAFGVVGGLVAGSLLFVMGISLLEIGILYVWPLALLLMLVHPRYLCFAYAGGLVGAVAAIVQLLGSVMPFLTVGIFAGISNIHIPGLLALIGTLHLTESMLIAFSGHMYPSPVYLKTEQGIVGGFMLQKFWPLPFVGIMAEVISQLAAANMTGTEMPPWWPLFASRIAVGAGSVLMYYVVPIVAGLGYGDIAVSTTPREKSKRSALNLALYSSLVLLLAMAAQRVPVITFIAALFVPFGHEFLISRGNKKEFAGTPIYRAPTGGVQVLDLFADSVAKAAGIQPGDIIVNINGSPVQSLHQFHLLVRTTWLPMQLLVQRADKDQLIIINSPSDLGIIPVPDQNATAYMVIQHEHLWGAVKKKLQRIKKTFRIF